MKVYCFKPNGGYQGGCIIVAANSPLEALGAIHANSHVDSEYTDLGYEKRLPIIDERKTDPYRLAS